MGDVWNKLLKKTKRRKAGAGFILEHGRIVEYNDQEIIIGFDNSFHKNKSESAGNYEIIQAAVKEILGEQVKLKFIKFSNTKKKPSGEKALKPEDKKKLPPITEPIIQKAMELFKADIQQVKDISSIDE